MEQNANFTGGSAASQVDPKELQEAAFNVMKQAAGTGAPVLNAFAQLQQRRAARLELAGEALRARFGEKDPAVATVDAMSRSALELKAQLGVQVTRARQWPRPRPNEWMVFGTVWDAKGQPAAELTVRVFDRDRKYDDLLGETETDEFGDFSVIYHERDFKETREALPDLYVLVSDLSGKTLYSSLDSVRFEAGRSEYFAIHLGARKPGRDRTAPRPAAAAARKKTNTPPAAARSKKA